MTSRNLRIGIPSKGRLADHATQLLQEAGLSFRRQDRSLFAKCRDLPIDITFLRTDDIGILCCEGAIDLGVTGLDLIAEKNLDVNIRLKLGIGRCRLALCVPETSKVESARDLQGANIATSFPHLTSQFFENLSVKTHRVELSGSVEIMVTLGVADAIVDLVETGSTLAANRLRVLDEIGQFETALIESQANRHADLTSRIVRRLEGVIIARSYSLLEYNVPREKLKDAEAITPGYHSPTVSALEDESWCAVKVMVRRELVLEAMERLEAVGATAMLEMAIDNCRL